MIVHMGWVGSEPPQAVLDAVEATRAASPGCDVMFHTDESMVPAEWLAVSLRLRPQMRSDVQRHAILRRWGGLWLDADVRVVRDPAGWAAGWDRYTTVRLAGPRGSIGTDIIYVPEGWGGWEAVEQYIGRTLDQINAKRRVEVMALAGSMIQACRSQRPDAFQILEPQTIWPFSIESFTSDSVVARGFDPPAHPPAAMPSLARRAATFTKAVARHVAAGMPRASDEEIERWYAICQQCEHYDGAACRKCGCGVSRERRFASKLAWAGERCPVGKWGPEAKS